MTGGWNKMMKQMQKMQDQMVSMQKELAERELEATSGGGAVKAVANGKKEIVSLKIAPDLLEDNDDAEMLEDMVIAAVNEVLKKVDEMTSEEMQKITGGMNLPPGLF